MAINSVFCPQCGASVTTANSSVDVGTPQDKTATSESELVVVSEKSDRDELTNKASSELGSEDERSNGTRRSVWSHPVAIGLIVIALILASGGVVIAIKDHHDDTVTNISTTQTTIHESGLVSANLPLSSCTTTYGISGTKPARLPNYVTEMIPRGDAGKLKVFADAQGIMELVGPSQWGCDASIGADGTSTLFIGPVNTDNYSGKLASSSTVEQISGSQTSASPVQAAEQACALFNGAESVLYPSTCTATSPSSEVVTDLNRHVAEFIDPPGVYGNGNPSGGAYPARGAITYYSQTAPESGGSYMETCILPFNQQSLCSASVYDFVSNYGSK